MNLLKYVIIVTVVLSLVQCKNDGVLEDHISRFQAEQIEDLREVVFSVSAERVGGMTYILYGEVDDSLNKKRLISELTDKGFKIQDSIRTLPFDVPQPFALVELSVTTMRSGPSHTSSMLSQALMGTPVKVLKTEGGWAYIQTPDKYLGWCEAGALHFMADDALNNWKRAKKVMVTERSSVIKDLDAQKVIRDIVAGNILEVLDKTPERYIVETPDGKVGFLEAEQAEPFSETSFEMPVNVDDVKADALDLLGTPYLWGGTSVRSLDCSGFTKTVYQLQGLVLARDASLQVRHGKMVSLANGWRDFETGDLLFFSPNEDSERITHVGFYLGDSEFIHEAGRVKINSLDSTRRNYSPYRDKTLKQVRRITGEEGSKGIVPIFEHPWYVN